MKRAETAHSCCTDLIKAVLFGQSHLINEISSNLAPPTSNPPVRAVISPQSNRETERVCQRSKGVRRTGERKATKGVNKQFTMSV